MDNLCDNLWQHQKSKSIVPQILTLSFSKTFRSTRYFAKLRNAEIASIIFFVPVTRKPRKTGQIVDLETLKKLLGETLEHTS